MAFFQQDDDELKKQQQDPAAGVPGAQGSSMLGSGAASPNAPQAATSPNAPDNPGNFVGIKTYLDANKNQASKLGDQASGVINTSAQGARNAVGGLNTAFNNAAGAPTVFNPDAVQKVGQGAEKLTPEERAQIKSQYNAQYSGPMDLTDTSLMGQYTDAQKKLSTAKTNVESSGTEQGRKGLIGQINDKPRTAGIDNFDNVLLQSGTGREKLANAATTNKDVTEDVLGAANQTAAQKAAANKAAADKARTETQNAVGTANTQFTSQFDPNNQQSKLAQAIAKALQANNSVYQDLGNDAYSLDQENLEKFGLSEGQRSYGINPMDYFKQSDPTQINASNVASGEDYARSQALAELMGGESFLNPANASQAGTYEQYTGKIDKDKLAADLGAKETEYNKKLKLSVDDLNDKLNDGGVLYNPMYSIDQLLNNEPSAHGGWYINPQAQASIPKGKLGSATPKEVQEKWLPWVNNWLKIDPSAIEARNLRDYLTKYTSPFKVTSSNTFKKNA